MEDVPGEVPTEVVDWVGDLLRRFRATGDAGLVDLADAAPHPSSDLVACTATVREDPDGEDRRHVLLVGGPAGAVTVRRVLGAGEAAAPVWSPDGARLCVLAGARDGLATAVVVDLAGSELGRAHDLGGTVETARWSADGTLIALVVAEPGAEISDVWGSGVVGGDESESWRPVTWPRSGGRRRLVVWDVAAGAHHALTDLNVWEADWLGDDLVALVSEGADEGAWYAARLVLISTRGATTPLHREHLQLARPAGSPDGRRWSALAGLASDRDLLAGRLLVGTPGAAPAAVPTSGVHVTDHCWTSAADVLFIGHRGLDTVVGTVDVDRGEVTELWSGQATTGRYQPELGGRGPDGRPVLVLEQHDLPPTLVRVRPDGARETLLGCAGPGADAVRSAVGSTRPVSWTSPDGLTIEGLLDLPREGRAPYPLVVHVHGGPICAHQDGWIGRDPHTTLLVARGYAVLRPNPRGSAGRGADFAEAVLGDMGGRDATDVLAGVERLVADGIVDPDRVGVTGQSYGGFMACWLPCLTDVFRAAVSRSPCTDWRSFHLTSNLAEFDRLFLDGDPWDPASQYETRNPVAQHARIRTPMLLTAGALDLACPPHQAQQMHHALRERGIPTALAVYPEEGHGVQAPPALADQCARMVAWFEEFMPARTAAPRLEAAVSAGTAPGRRT